MQFPIGFQVEGQTKADSDRHFFLKLNKNVYGLKQGSYSWYKKLKTSPVDRNFKPSDIDPCLYNGNVMIMFTYVDYWIIVGPSMVAINVFIKSMKVGTEKFTPTDEGKSPILIIGDSNFCSPSW